MFQEPHAGPMPDLRDKPADYEGIADFLSALSYPARLELLHLLRFPHVLSEIKISARRSGGGEATREHTSSRPAVLGHLEKLEAHDLVRCDQVEQDGRKMNRYVVNSLKLYELTEELRRLSVIYAGRGPTGDVTGTLAASPTASPAMGPRLVLVHGLYEGKSYSLDPRRKPEAEWLIGRRKGLSVTLDYDPFVSMENSAVRMEGRDYTVTDLKTSKNGTAVNWAPLPKGGTWHLKAGDVIGVGRSLLSFVPQ